MKALAETLEGSEVSELDLTEGGTRISIRRRLNGDIVTVGATVAHSASSTAHRVSMRRPHVENGNDPANSAPDPGVAIVAPLTGVFYTAPSPASANFAPVGEPVNAGQIICIIEAMKVFNEIKSEVSGTVTAIVPKNGQLVQKGDVLIRVKPV